MPHINAYASVNFWYALTEFPIELIRSIFDIFNVRDWIAQGKWIVCVELNFWWNLKRKQI